MKALDVEQTQQVNGGWVFLAPAAVKAGKIIGSAVVASGGAAGTYAGYKAVDEILSR